MRDDHRGISLRTIWPANLQSLVVQRREAFVCLQGQVQRKGVCNESALEWVACNMTQVYFRKLQKACQGRRQQESCVAYSECAP